MAGIKNRIFGADIPINIKRKLESRQKLNHKIQGPNDEISPSDYTDILNQNQLNSKFGDFGEMNFNGLADASSRTPFIRMWTAVNLSKSLKTEVTVTEGEEFEKWWIDRTDKNTFLRKSVEDNTIWEEFKWERYGDSERIYQLGNNTLNTFERDINAPRSEEVKSGDNTISENVVKATMPYEQESDFNGFLKPPAGITGLTSETQGALGVVKSTTVNFQVHNFADFDKIYLKYFMKPGAQVFVDFGYDTAFLYNPKLVIDAGTGIQDKLFGDKGYVTLSNGDMETLYGHVTDFDAKVREDGGFDCSVTIMSKNFALLSSNKGDEFKNQVKRGLDTELLAVMASGLFGDESIAQMAMRWTNHTAYAKELDMGFKEVMHKAFGGKGISVPGETATAVDKDGNLLDWQSKIALRLGVFIYQVKGSNNNSEFKTYVNFGWFEDNFLNRYYGFSADEKDLSNSGANSNADDSGKLMAKYDSSNSYCTWNHTLQKAMKSSDKGKNSKLRDSILFPASWGENATYNMDRKTLPSLTDEEILTLESDSVSTNNLPEFDERKVFYTKREKTDRELDRIPLREIFISTDLIKQSFDNGNDTVSFLETFMGKVRQDSNGVVDLGLTSNDYGQQSIAFVDKNYIMADINSNNSNEYFKNLITFNPYSPDTICKSFDVSFAMPEGGLGNMLAIQGTADVNDTAGSGGVVTDMKLKKLLRSFNELEKLDRKTIVKNDDGLDEEIEDVFVRYLPEYGAEEASLRYLKTILGQERYGNFAFDTEGMIFSPKFAHQRNSNIKPIVKHNFIGSTMREEGTGTNYSNIKIVKNNDGESRSNLYEVMGSGAHTRIKDAGITTPNANKKLAEMYHELHLGLHNVKNKKTFGSGEIPISQKAIPMDNKESSETTSELNKKKYNGYYIVSNPVEYAEMMDMVVANNTVSPVLPIKASLGISGMSTFTPGDICNINYLPSKYSNRVYFQITKVSHEVNITSWTTSFETIMRVRPLTADEKFDRDKVRIDKSYLDNSELNDWNKYSKYFANFIPYDFNSIENSHAIYDSDTWDEYIIKSKNNPENYQLSLKVTDLNDIKKGTIPGDNLFAPLDTFNNPDQAIDDAKKAQTATSYPPIGILTQVHSVQNHIKEAFIVDIPANIREYLETSESEVDWPVVLPDKEDDDQAKLTSIVSELPTFSYEDGYIKNTYTVGTRPFKNLGTGIWTELFIKSTNFSEDNGKLVIWIGDASGEWIVTPKTNNWIPIDDLFSMVYGKQQKKSTFLSDEELSKALKDLKGLRDLDKDFDNNSKKTEVLAKVLNDSWDSADDEDIAKKIREINLNSLCNPPPGGWCPDGDDDCIKLHGGRRRFEPQFCKELTETEKQEFDLLGTIPERLEDQYDENGDEIVEEPAPQSPDTPCATDYGSEGFNCMYTTARDSGAQGCLSNLCTDNTDVNWMCCPPEDVNTPPANQISGCTDSEACNFNPNANIEDQTCVYPETNFDCDGNEVGFGEEGYVCSDDAKCWFDVGCGSMGDAPAGQMWDCQWDGDDGNAGLGGCCVLVNDPNDTGSLCGNTFGSDFSCINIDSAPPFQVAACQTGYCDGGSNIKCCPSLDSMNEFYEEGIESDMMPTPEYGCPPGPDLQLGGMCECCIHDTSLNIGGNGCPDGGACEDGCHCNSIQAGSCPDPTACNYNPFSSDDNNNNCLYITCADGSCAQQQMNCQNEDDYCANGSGMLKCPAVGGNNFCEEEYSSDYECNGWFNNRCCELKAADCAGVPGGSAVIDDCGVCGGDNSTCSDCAGTPNGSAVIDQCGICGGDNSSCVDLCGVPNGDNSTCSGCTDSEADNFNESATVDDGSCSYTEDTLIIEGCTDSEASNYNQNATDDDGSCEYVGEDIEGCMDSEATNYNQLANIDDGSCMYPDSEVVEGCMDESACNYNLNVNMDDGSCYYPDDGYDCDGVCIAGEDCAGICGGTTIIDCANICGGTSEIDECGTCGGDVYFGPNAGDYCDCNGNILDECNICGGGETDPNNCCEPSDRDVCGVCNGPGEIYDCGCRTISEQCGGDGFCDCMCNIADCAGVCGGDSELDGCGVCNGNNSPNTGTCDCEGTPDGTAVVGCDGVCNSGLVEDQCGVCGGDGPPYECPDGTMSCDLTDCCIDCVTICGECGSGEDDSWEYMCDCNETECPSEYCDCDTSGINSCTPKSALGSNCCPN